jgi:hypothetical protein
VSLPYSVQTNDVPAYFEMKVSVPEFEAMLRRQFDVLYREGEAITRVMASRSTRTLLASATGSALSTRRSITSVRMPEYGAPPAGKSCSISWRSSRKRREFRSLDAPCRTPAASMR